MTKRGVGGQESDLNISHKFSPDFLDFSEVGENTEELEGGRAKAEILKI